jgi:uncharacterized MnhB-related membrane protein
MLYAILVGGIVCCAAQAVRAHRLLEATLWLAGASGLTSILLYALDAPQVAVIELSVGAGLVTVLFVYAIGVAGESTRDMPSLVPKPLAWGLIVLSVALLGWLIWPLREASPATTAPPFSDQLWEGRALDVWVQILLIFSGVLGVLGLLTDTKAPAGKQIEAPASDVPAARPRALAKEVD